MAKMEVDDFLKVLKVYSDDSIRDSVNWAFKFVLMTKQTTFAILMAVVSAWVHVHGPTVITIISNWL